MKNSKKMKISKMKHRYVLGGELTGMCTKFQVDIFENDVFIALGTFKIVTFHDISMHYQAILLFVSIVDLCAQHGSKVIFRAQDDKTAPKHAS